MISLKLRQGKQKYEIRFQPLNICLGETHKDMAFDSKCQGIVYIFAIFSLLALDIQYL